MKRPAANNCFLDFNISDIREKNTFIRQRYPCLFRIADLRMGPRRFGGFRSKSSQARLRRYDDCPYLAGCYFYPQ